MNSPGLSLPAKVQPLHLARQAVVYLRPSSPKQVRENLGSQLNQRSLVERARALGGHPTRSEVLDGDRGQSGTASAGREDFQARQRRSGARPWGDRARRGGLASCAQ
jgi:hypothetical protein